MRFIFNDGGREAAGFKGTAGDCVCRSIAIVTGRPYREVYGALAAGNASERRTGRSRKSAGVRSARNGILTKRQWFKDYMRSIGFEWVSTMGIGTGCRVHLHDGELPPGRLVVAVSRHYTAVIDGEIHDTHNPQRAQEWIAQDRGQSLRAGQVRKDGKITWVERRCVYGYWRFTG